MNVWYTIGIMVISFLFGLMACFLVDLLLTMFRGHKLRPNELKHGCTICGRKSFDLVTMTKDKNIITRVYKCTNCGKKVSRRGAVTKEESVILVNSVYNMMDY